MTKRKPKFLYACSHCKEVYTTKKQALKCIKNVADHFKAGDVVRFHGNVWRITNMKDNAATLEKTRSHRLAFGQTWKDRQQKWFWQPVATFCGKEMQKIDKREAKSQLKLRLRQAEAAQQFFNLCVGKEGEE